MIDEPSPRPRQTSILVSTQGVREADDLLESLGPALGRLGTWRRIAHPESSLAQAVADAERAGLRPIHLSIGTAQDCYLTPAVATVLLPVWHYPAIPSVDINRNSRLNWARVARFVDLILAPSEFTAGAFRSAEIDRPVAVIPIPPRSGWSDLPTWGPGMPLTVHVPHEVHQSPPEEFGRATTPTNSPREDDPADEPGQRSGWRGRFERGARRRLRAIKPYLSNATVERLDRVKGSLAPLLRPSPVGLIKGTARLGYRYLVRRWIGEGRHQALRGLSHRLRGRRWISNPSDGPGPLGPSPLTLSGLVYAATIDLSDPTTDESTLVSAFLHAFHDRDDVTLLIRLPARTHSESADFARIAHCRTAPGIAYRCRIVVVSGRISADEGRAIGRATTYQVEPSRNRGCSLAAVEALASGRPLLAPAIGWFVEAGIDEVGFSVATDEEPTGWPSDGRGRHATTWHRIAWSSLRDRFLESAEVAETDHRTYERMSSTARSRIALGTNPGSIAATMADALELVTSRSADAFAWA